MGNKINLNELKSALKDLKDAKELLKNPNITNIGTYSMLQVDDQISIAVVDLRAAVKECYNMIPTEALSSMIKRIENVEYGGKQKAKEEKKKQQEKNKKIEEERKNMKNKKGSTGGSSSSGKSNKKKKKKSVLKSVKTSMLETSALISPANSLLVQVNTLPKPAPSFIELTKNELEEKLKNNDTAAATESYKLLKSTGQEESAKELLEKNGYQVEEKDGKIIISKKADNQTITEENTTSTIETKTETADTNTTSTETEVVASEVKEEVKSQESNNGVKEEIKPQEYNGEVKVANNQANNNSQENSSNYQEHSSNNSYNSNYNNNAQANNASTNVTTETKQVETPNVTQETSEPNATTETPKTTTKSTKPSIVTITEEETTTSKKSSGLGTVAAVGLGTVAVGAAAVAGARYVKNRNNESYNEENDDGDDDSESYSESSYEDSAQYESDYTNDNYLAGDSYEEVAEEYVDPEDLENTEDDFSNDTVLNNLD